MVRSVFKNLFCQPLPFNDTFIPFTFKAVINVYAPVPICLIVFLCFVRLLLLLHFLPREVPLAFAIRLIWWC